MGLRGPGVQGVHGLRGLAEAKLKKSFYKTFLKLPNYYRKVVSDVHLHEQFMSYGAQGSRASRGSWAQGSLRSQIEKQILQNLLKIA